MIVPKEDLLKNDDMSLYDELASVYFEGNRKYKCVISMICDYSISVCGAGGSYIVKFHTSRHSDDYFMIYEISGIPKGHIDDIGDLFNLCVRAKLVENNA
jgi:hypothetical protein